MAKMSPLRRRMIEDMTVRNLPPATQLPSAEPVKGKRGRRPAQMRLPIEMTQRASSWKDQAATALPSRRRLRNAIPNPPKPASIIVHVAASGTPPPPRKSP